MITVWLQYNWHIVLCPSCRHRSYM